MKRTLLSFILATIGTASAISSNTVEIVYNGTTATVTVDSNISKYVTVSSGTSSHVVITQSTDFAGVNKTPANTDGEITYSLSGTSSNGSFYLEGSYKCIVQLNGVTLTNPGGPAINIQNGKRIEVSAKSGTTSTLTDGTNETYNGCFHCKGHTKLKGKGTLNVVGNSKHAIYSKEYCEVKNLTFNITSAVKDGIHCKEYFLMESGTLTINGVGDDGIQVEQDANSPITGSTTKHEDENSGNFYMEGGTLTISNYKGKAIVADGSITYSNNSTQNFDTSDTKILAGIEDLQAQPVHIVNGIYDLQGRRLNAVPQRRSVYIIVENGAARKVFRK